MGIQAVGDTLNQTAKVVTGTPALLARLDPWMLVLIVISTLAALILSLWMVYSSVNRIRTDEIRRQMLYDAVFDSTYRKLEEQSGVSGMSPPWEEDPDQLQEQRRGYETDLKAVLERASALRSMETRTPAEQQDLRGLDDEAEKLSRLLAVDVAEAKITRIREDIRQRREKSEQSKITLRKDAQRQTEVLVPRSLTVAGMGITGAFFIELTAILTIIFGIIILGLVGVLTTTEIAPILAAIAGYVLGKTTSGWAPYGGPAWLQQTPTPQAGNHPSPAAQPPAQSQAPSAPSPP